MDEEFESYEDDLKTWEQDQVFLDGLDDYDE